jgi:16S rRNA (cytosine1402-N4)-methyltransferase
MTWDQTTHVPIMVGPILNGILPPFESCREESWIVDCTLGGGGHTGEFLRALKTIHQQTGIRHRVLSVDRDPSAITRAKLRFVEELREGILELHEGPFSTVAPRLEGKRVLGLLADLGFSSDQIDQDARGFSFLREGPLDMRMDPTRGQSAFEYLRLVREQDLADALFQYAEERYSRKIAGFIVEARRKGELPTTTTGLAALVSRALPASQRHGRIHPATRTFQALRIVVNEELEELDCLLEDIIGKIVPGGRAAIMSFHSLEDRKVKQVFKASPSAHDGPKKWSSMTKKPIEADEDEQNKNPRSRSAKLRIAERLRSG